VLPLSASIGAAARNDGRRSRIRALVLTGASLALLAAVAGRTSGLLVLAVAAAALGATAVLGLRARAAAGPAATRRTPARSVLSSAVANESLDADDLTARLRRLHDDHVEQVNQAVGEGREDLVQELSDSYMNESLALITAGAHLSPEHFHSL
jgi:hypothetical protein